MPEYLWNWYFVGLNGFTLFGWDVWQAMGAFLVLGVLFGLLVGLKMQRA